MSVGGVSALVKIASLSESIVESEKNVNGLVELIQYLRSEEESVVKAAVSALERVYSHLCQQEEHHVWLRAFPLPLSQVEGCPHDDEVLYEYQCWMRSMYGSCRDQLLCLLLHPNQSLAAAALQLLMQMVGWEGHAHPQGRYFFPNHLFHTVVCHVLDGSLEGEALIGQLEEWLAYHDVLLHWLKNIASIAHSKLDTKKDSVPAHCFVEKVYCGLQAVSMPTDEDELQQFLAGLPLEGQRSSDDGSKKSKVDAVMSLQKYRKHFSDAWLAFLRLSLPPPLLRQVLVDLHSAVMPHLLDPRLLLDFLSSAHSSGGVVSLLALNGLFILMNDYHLDYPSFYPNLYQLLQASVFHVKYTARFFRLLDTFLSSTHLPLYLVAAFVKKLSRLGLSAPPEGVVLVVVMVTNLIKRHPNCRVLLHRTNAEDYTLTSDPYDPDEPDPAESGALDSCLWELKTLQQHCFPAVSQLVCTLTSPEALSGRRQETDLHKHLRSMDQYKRVDFESEASADVEVTLNCSEPASLW